ncbi:MAG: hypothetical protein BM562_15095 [Alphaproteobacteria bacterium MedPE-SWcel]|nr:MAG: hypothetical protein BM562_15095 [Alphaproteobacteria bacterium MedPE-SWcel]
MGGSDLGWLSEAAQNELTSYLWTAIKALIALNGLWLTIGSLQQILQAFRLLYEEIRGPQTSAARTGRRRRMATLIDEFKNLLNRLLGAENKKIEMALAAKNGVQQLVQGGQQAAAVQ